MARITSLINGHLFQHYILKRQFVCTGQLKVKSTKKIPHSTITYLLVTSPPRSPIPPWVKPSICSTACRMQESCGIRIPASRGVSDSLALKIEWTQTKPLVLWMVWSWVPKLFDAIGPIRKTLDEIVSWISQLFLTSTDLIAFPPFENAQIIFFLYSHNQLCIILWASLATNTHISHNYLCR